MGRKGPFGLQMGASCNEVGTELVEIAPCKYKASVVPKPHSAFESYVLQIAPSAGLCWVKAIGHTIATSNFGIELRSAFDTMEVKLAATYGKHEKMDFLMPESIWNEPRDWMSGLQHKERHLMAVWSAEHGSNLIDSIETVALVASALGSNEGFISVEYAFENASVAEAEIAAMEDEAL